MWDSLGYAEINPYLGWFYKFHSSIKSVCQKETYMDGQKET